MQIESPGARLGVFTFEAVSTDHSDGFVQPVEEPSARKRLWAASYRFTLEPWSLACHLAVAAAVKVTLGSFGVVTVGAIWSTVHEYDAAPDVRPSGVVFPATS
jgi:hypothetical protein